MKYIVTWLIIKTVVISCPYPKPIEPKYNEFGQQLAYTPAELRQMEMDQLRHEESYCWREDTTQKQKGFQILDSALAFIKRGKQDSISNPSSTKYGILRALGESSFSESKYDSRIANFKIDSLITLTITQ